jgi:hypothetical protein
MYSVTYQKTVILQVLFALKVLKLIKFWRVDKKFKIIHLEYIVIHFTIPAFACKSSGKFTPDMHWCGRGSNYNKQREAGIINFDCYLKYVITGLSITGSNPPSVDLLYYRHIWWIYFHIQWQRAGYKPYGNWYTGITTSSNLKVLVIQDLCNLLHIAILWYTHLYCSPEPCAVFYRWYST